MQSSVPLKTGLLCIVHLKIVNERATRHGDYRKGPMENTKSRSAWNKYKFLITLDLMKFRIWLLLKKFEETLNRTGTNGNILQQLDGSLSRPEIFLNYLLCIIVGKIFQEPHESSDTDANCPWR
jgi:hypothetical protein